MQKSLLIFLLPLCLYAQPNDFQFQPEAFPVTIEGWQPFCPWAGGDSETAPDFCDIDADGDLDLFVGNISGYIRYFKNYGNSTAPDFKLVERQYDSLSTIQDWGRSNPDFYDLDNDGDYVALIGSGRVTYVENIGNNLNPCFLSNRDTLFDISGNWVFGTHVSVVDIDWDYDGDLVCGEYQGHLQFYRNVGTPDSFAFYLEDNYWLDIDVGGYADPTFIDIDGDNDYDLFIGDEDGHIHYYRNDGDFFQWDFTLVSNNFLNIDVGDYASPEFGDVDGDGDYDLLVGREGNMNMEDGDIYYYLNIGDAYNFQFQLATKNYLSIDLGLSPPAPQLVDIDNDGLKDLFITKFSGLSYYHNNGTTANASFEHICDNYQNLLPWHPLFLDIDGDGDYDYLGGEAVIPGPPVIKLYLNQGTPEVADFALYNPQFITNPNFYVNAHPSCADIDADGDLDLFVTDDNGYVYYYQNNGDPTRPEFEYITNTWQGMFFLMGGWCELAFGDLDGDSDLDMLTRSVFGWNDYGNLCYYRNDGTVNNPIMVLDTTIFLPGFTFYQGMPFLVDIDNDTDLDLFVGNSDGGVMFFRNLEVNSVNREPGTGNRSFVLQQCYPNPFNEVLTIPFTLEQALPVKIVVYDVLGREVRELGIGNWELGKNTIVWEAGGRSSGVYYISLENPEQKQIQKVILLK